ncbi:hydrogenase maturation protease [Candidatus Woesearchaeota archaeon]|nr:hydrogenase maturation protease [Candidatus Woesearchaeota archaeon]
MGVKIIFVGNPLGGDDGVGPHLYSLLREDDRLKDYDLLELGVIGLDMVSYVEDDDKLIIIDAVRSEENVGEVVLLAEEDLTSDLKVVSQHDFGIEETSKVLRIYKPSLDKISFVGIKVKEVKSYNDKLSKEITNKIDIIKEEVVKKILEAIKK